VHAVLVKLLIAHIVEARSVSQRQCEPFLGAKLRKNVPNVKCCLSVVDCTHIEARQVYE